MTYLGNDLQVAYPTYRNIDDISGSFNGVTTSFALLVGGVAPVPLPLNSQQCLISVAGVVLRPDDTGTEGFRLSGGNIIFQSAPSGGADFFGVILAGADYINVGVNFPSGSAAVPSITFDSDLDTGIYNSAANNISITTGGTQRLVVDSSGRLGLGTSSPSQTLDIVGDARITNSSGSTLIVNRTSNPGSVAFAHSGTETGQIQAVSGGGLNFYIGSTPSLKATIDSSGRLGLGTSSPQQELHINDATGVSRIRLTGGAVGTDNFEIGQAIPGVSNSGFSIYDVDATASRFVIDSSGNVGIGTTSPAQALSVVGNIIADGSAASQYVASSKAGVTSTYLMTDANGGNIQTDGAWPIRFTINSTERARIDSSGRLLVGTSTARANYYGGAGNAPRFQIEGNDYLDGGASFTSNNNSIAGWGPHIALGRSRGGSIGSNTIVQNGDGTGTIIFHGNDGTNFIQSARIDAFVDGTPGANDMPGRIVLSTTADGASSPTERMRIGANGVVTINSGGVATANQSFVQVINGRSSQNLGYVSADISGNEWHFGRSTSDGYFYVVRQTGTGMYMNTNSWVATSDQRAKQNIADIESSIDVVKALKPSRFNWKSDGIADVGFIAQQVQTLIPEAVVDSGNPDAMLGITQDKLLPFVVKALQEAIAKIETLEAKVTALEGK